MVWLPRIRRARFGGIVNRLSTNPTRSVALAVAIVGLLSHLSIPSARAPQILAYSHFPPTRPQHQKSHRAMQWPSCLVIDSSKVAQSKRVFPVELALIAQNDAAHAMCVA